MALSTSEPRAGSSIEVSPRPPLAGSPGASRRRWAVAGMLFLAAVLNYLDRSILGLLAPTIQKELNLSDGGYAQVVNAFLVAYTISYLFSGRVVDAVGSRASLALFIAFWSAANALTAAARSVVSLGFYRFLLGLGEAGGYTASPKVVSEWFAPKERAFAVGLYSIGSSVGATIAPLLVMFSATRFGWRGAFVITGLLGLLWIVPWLLIARRPSDAASQTRHSTGRGHGPIGVGPVAVDHAQPVVWRLMLARLLTDSVWYFYLFWMPKYLHDARGVEQTGLVVMWVIFLAADVGFPRRRVPLRPPRPPRPGAAREPHVDHAAGRVSRARVGRWCRSPPRCGSRWRAPRSWRWPHCMWLGNLSALVVDVVPAAHARDDVRLHRRRQCGRRHRDERGRLLGRPELFV